MSSGRLHTQATLITAGALVLSRVGYPANLELAAGALLGIFVSPDLDVDAGSIADYFIRRCGWIGRALEKVWDLLWWPYRKSFKHASPLSHWPIISTFVRVFYLGTFGILLPCLVLELTLPGTWDMRRELAWVLDKLIHHQAVFWGLAAADFVHFGLDITTTDHRKKG